MPRTSALFTTLDLALPEIEALGNYRRPLEACGLLLDTPWRDDKGKLSYIKELPNRSLTPGEYRIDPADIELVMDGLDDVEDVAVWHTHPSGFIGPSKGDLVHRMDPCIYMLVVALTPTGPVATWF